MSDHDSLPPPNEYIASAFGEGGYLARRFDGYRPRSGQVALARAVDDAIAAGDHLMAEAPTGTGKSLAYLVPATYRASREKARMVTEYGGEPPEDADGLADTRVIVVTANIALQEQLCKKDLPTLSEILPWKFNYGLLKGKNNHLCLSQLYAFREQGLEFSPTPDELDQIEDIQAWAKDCVSGAMLGDMSELPFEPTHRVWRNFSVSNNECSGSDCQYYEPCFARRQQAKARKSTVIVTNYHMLLAHLQVRSMTNMHLVLPPASTIILDEVHRFADIARDVLGFRITKEMVMHTVRRLRRDGDSEDVRAEQDVREHAGRFYDAIYAFKMSGKYKTRIKSSVVEADSAVKATWASLDHALQFGKHRIDKRLEKLTFQMQQGLGSDQDTRRRFGMLHRAKERLIELRTQIDQAIHMRGGEENVYFIDVDEKNRVFLSAKPIHVGGWLRDQLFGKTPSVVCTSATMCVSGKFDYLAREVGCEYFGKCHAESPFAWSEQAMLITPSEMPAPNDLDFRDAVAEATVEVITHARGRTLGLFTSRKMLDYVHGVVKSMNLPYRILRQGDAPRVKLIEDFKRDVSSVLLGTESFWAGVDVPGESLSAVVIDRIPFPSPDDPIADAIAERDDKWFKNYSTPRAAIQLKQGFGRLIRSQDDVGVVVLLDRRIIDKPYGKIFIRSLPNVSLSNDIADVGRFLNRKRRRDMTEDERLEDAFT